MATTKSVYIAECKRARDKHRKQRETDLLWGAVNFLKAAEGRMAAGERLVPLSQSNRSTVQAISISGSIPQQGSIVNSRVSFGLVQLPISATGSEVVHTVSQA